MQTIRTTLTGKNFMRSILAVLFLLLGFGVIVAVLFANFSTDKKEIAIGTVDFIKSGILIMIGFYFGSSQSSSEKNEMLNAKP